MSGLAASAQWLDLREPADHRSRNRKLEQRARQALRRLAARSPSSTSAAAPAPTCAPPRRCWAPSSTGRSSTTTRRCSRPPPSGSTAWADGADRQGGTLALFKGAKRINVEFRRADLAGDLEAALGPNANLVTASALFDLASAEFIARFAAAVAAAKSAFYTVLTYDGDQRWTPEHEADAALARGFPRPPAARQGLRPRRRSGCAGRAERGFRRRGYAVPEGDSAWRLGAGDEALIAELAAGFADAVRETGQVDAPTIAAWRAVTRTGAVVGHTDTLALPPTG